MAQVTVTIEVQTISNQHGYIKGWETFQFKGENRNRLWTIWTKDIGNLNEHDVITVNGDLSTKAATYVPKNATEAKQIVEHSLNNVAIGLVSAGTNSGTNSGTNTGTQVRNASDILTQKTDTDPIDMPF